MSCERCVELEKRLEAAESERDALRERCEKAEAVVAAVREDHAPTCDNAACPACVAVREYDAAREGKG